jgi:hypothetical protein
MKAKKHGLLYVYLFPRGPEGSYALSDGSFCVLAGQEREGQRRPEKRMSDCSLTWAFCIRLLFFSLCLPGPSTKPQEKIYTKMVDDI